MTADTIGGVWTYSLDLGNELIRRGIEVDLATMGRPLSADQWRQVEEVPFREVHESSFRLEWMDDPWEDVADAGAWLLELAGRIEPDLVHVNGFTHGSLEWPCPVLVVGHSCVLSWWRAVKGCDAPESWGRYEEEVRKGIHSADALAAPTRAMLDELARLYGPRVSRFVVYNGRSSSQIHPRDKEQLILSAGRLWDEAKNVKALQAVAPALPWRVRIAGDFRHPESGDGPAPGELFLGHVPHVEMLGWYGSASIFALPAKYEPFGLAALEAGLAGCCLVLGDIPSLREVWADAAVFVDPEDESALSETLTMLIAEDRLRGAFGERARERALFYSTERMGLSYEQLYKQLVGGAGATAGRVEEVT